MNELCRLRSERTIRSLRRRAKKKDRKKAIDFGPAASLRAESSRPGLQQAGYGLIYGRMRGKRAAAAGGGRRQSAFSAAAPLAG